MLSIFKREFSAYFTSPLGYVFIAVSFLTSGFLFFMTSLYVGSTDLSGVYSIMYLVYMFMIPILSMRLIADDKRQKTDQLLLTSPINLFSLVVGKYLAAFLVFVMSSSAMLIYAVVLSAFASINWSIILGYWLGLTLVGGVYVAFGLLISCLTQNQMIAAIVGIILNFIMFLSDSLVGAINNTIIRDVLQSLSLFNRYNEFTMGFFSITNILFFCSMIFVFLFLAVRILERRRWA